METLSLSEAKMKPSKLVDKVSTMDEEILITKNGRPVAVLVSPDEYEGWRETVHIRSDASFMKEIQWGLKVLDRKDAKLYTIEEPEERRGLRVGRFRIVYRMAEENEIQVVASGPRARVYEETYRLLRKERAPLP